MTDAEYCAVWARWDAKPGNEQAAGAILEADQVKAVEFGLKSPELRNVLSAWRRTGCDRAEALRRVRIAVETA